MSDATKIPVGLKRTGYGMADGDRSFIVRATLRLPEGKLFPEGLHE